MLLFVQFPAPGGNSDWLNAKLRNRVQGACVESVRACMISIQIQRDRELREKDSRMEERIKFNGRERDRNKDKEKDIKEDRERDREKEKEKEKMKEKGRGKEKIKEKIKEKEKDKENVKEKEIEFSRSGSMGKKGGGSQRKGEDGHTEGQSI